MVGGRGKEGVVSKGIIHLLLWSGPLHETWRKLPYHPPKQHLFLHLKDIKKSMIICYRSALLIVCTVNRG